MIQSDMALAEIWYQHIYDYFAGRTFPYSKDNDSSGLIHKNFGEFLRVVRLASLNTYKPSLDRLKSRKRIQ